MGVIERNGKEVYAYAGIVCKCWNCSYCGPRRAWRFCRRVAEVGKERGLNRLMTLTLDPSKLGAGSVKPGAVWEVWRKFRVYLRRRSGVTLSYVAVLELQKSGVPHLHVLVDQFIPQAWISERWEALGGGRIVDIRKVRDFKKVARYLGKYLAKGFGKRELYRARRYSCSRNIKLGEEKGPRWKRFRELQCGIEVIRDGARRGVVEEFRDAEGRVTFFTTTGPVIEAWRRG